MNKVKCQECGKDHQIEFGSFPDENDPVVNFAVVFDPADEFHFVFALRFIGDEGTVQCVVDCTLGEEAKLTYIDEFPYQKISWLRGLSFLPREKVLESGLDKTAFTIVKTLLSTCRSLVRPFKKWSSSV